MRPSQHAMMRRRRRTFGAAAVLTVVGLVAAQRTGDAQSPNVASEPIPSQSLLQSERAEQIHRNRAITRLQECPDRARACVDLTARMAWLQRDGRITYGPVPMGDGTKRKPTPVGSFSVHYKVRDYTSITYGIPMPYSVFFAGDGIAFHQGKPSVSSRGCVHLRRADARAFFRALRPGDRVVVRA